MKLILRLTRWLFILSVPVLLITGTLAAAFNSLKLYEYGFQKYQVSQAIGLTPSELDESARDLITYFNNRHQEFLDINVTWNTGETSPLFDQADILHMKDVKGLVWLDYWLLLGASVYLLIYIVVNFTRNRKNARRELSMGTARGAVATVALVGFLGVFAVTSFDWFFITFHEIFFPGGNWEFPVGDHMITIFPGGFWYDATIMAGLVILALALAVGGLGWLGLKQTGRHIAS
jgi:integral membrane protein (TIGR01906 family)